MSEKADLAEVLAGLCFALSAVTREHARAMSLAREVGNDDWELFIPSDLGRNTAGKTDHWLSTGVVP